ncbi:UDP-2,4-diacetamido-2,4,6-trideoxy-beta-L-altropyranose hydrolase [Flavobacteriales bacterium]|nr:UDP-2,4-diacetamido-2,4,6-trideoxy-beta-L-altropyranose hydrolase [Flavobacteriales bacterium]
MSKKATIILRCDANAEIGYGHLSRSIALYELLCVNFNCFIVTGNNNVNHIVPTHIQVALIPINLTPTQEGNWLLEKFSKNCILITDGYQYNEFYQQAIKQLLIPLVAVDDLAVHHQYADVVLNHAPKIAAKNYSKESYTHLSLGCRFAMLRSVFYDNFLEEIPKNKFKNIFISFGGSDQTKICVNAIKGLANYSKNITLNILVGNELISNNIAKDCVDTIKPKFHYGLTSNEVFDLIRQADLCIVSASTIMLEVASIGKPLIIGYYVKNQAFMYTGGIESGLAHGIGNLKDFDFNTIRNKIAEFESKNLLGAMMERQRKHFQSPIRNNITTLIQSLIDRLNFVPATASDGALLLHWRNDPTTIENSIVTQAVNPEDHHNWLSKILNDASVQLFIVHADKETIGTVRINSTLRDKEISWTIAPNHRGKGYGKTIVNKLVNSLEGTVIAQIKNSNIASKKIAEYAGLKMVSETNDLIKYQLKIS